MSDFWTRRRAAVAAEDAAVSQRNRQFEVSQRNHEADDRPEAEILEELGLPDPDTLKPGDDVAAFLRDEVPALIRRRALRNLWVSNPVLHCLDGLNDYDDDYRTAGTGVVKTAYRVGQGLTRHVEAMAAAAEEKAAPVEDAPVLDDQPAEDPWPEPAVAEAAPAAAADEPAPVPARRMTFRYHEEASA